MFSFLLALPTHPHPGIAPDIIPVMSSVNKYCDECAEVNTKACGFFDQQILRYVLFAADIAANNGIQMYSAGR
jgi:hypothetical protein